MRDPSNEIIDGLIGILRGNLAYNGNDFEVSADRPVLNSAAPLRFVWLREFEFQDFGTDTYDGSEGTFTIEVIVSGQKNEGSTKVINSINNQIMQLVLDQTIPMTNFEDITRVYLVNSFNITEGTRDYVINRKVLQINMECKEL